MHWTYQKYKDEDDLCQGDIIEPNPEINSLFKDVHPHFTHNKYLGFLILTQSCDLVRRPKNCKATHISLSVIRSLRDIVSDSLKDRFGYLAPGVFTEDKKKDVEDLFHRFLNQNENSLGLFYLHPHLDAGISEPCIALLRISISLRREHYKILTDARCGRLSERFQPKLGWMVGNLYSRVGVPDWAEKEPYNPDIEKTLLNQILSSTSPSSNRQEPLWIREKIFNKIKKKSPDFENLSSSEQEALIQKFLPPPPKEAAISQIAAIIKKAYPTISDDDLKKIKSHLTNDESLNGQMKKWAER